jgi:hypothetical protein
MTRLLRRGSAGAVGWILVASALATLPACFLAAAGAGAGGAVYITSRGAESLVNASIPDVAEAVEDAFTELGIEQTKTTVERGGDEREIRGEKGDLEVTVKFEREGPGTTQVEVTARENLAEWNKDYAKRVLELIVERS